MVIRHGEFRDAQSLSALAIQVWLNTYATEGVSSLISHYVLAEFSVQEFENLLMAKSSVVLVAEIDENLIGYAVVIAGTLCPESNPAEAELATLYVQAPFIGKGVGHALLYQAEEWAKQRLSTSLWLTVNSKNGRAIAFYSRQGYQQLSTTYFRLGNTEHENLVMGSQHA